MGRPNLDASASTGGYADAADPQEYHYDHVVTEEGVGGVDDYIPPPPFEAYNDEVQDYSNMASDPTTQNQQQQPPAQFPTYQNPNQPQAEAQYPPQNPQMARPPPTYPPPQAKAEPMQYPPPPQPEPVQFPPPASEAAHQPNYNSQPPPQRFPPAVPGGGEGGGAASMNYQPQYYAQAQQQQQQPQYYAQAQAQQPQYYAQAQQQQPAAAYSAAMPPASPHKPGVGFQFPNNTAGAGAGFAQGVPMANRYPTPQIGTQPWRTGLFDCMEDPQNAVLTACFPCLTFGQIAEIIDTGHTPCSTSGAMYGCIAFLIAMPCILSCTYRTKLRSKYGLVEAPAPDWAVHCLCEWCALCQEYRELNLRGLDPSIGWLGNVAKNQGMQQQQMGMMPPMHQTMNG